MKIWKNLFGRGDKIHADEIAVAPGLLLGGAVIVESGSNANGEYRFRVFRGLVSATDPSIRLKAEGWWKEPGV